MHDYGLGYRNKIVFPQNYAQNQFFIPAPPNYNYPNPSNPFINVNQNNIMKGNQSINSGSNYYPSYTEKPDQNNNILYKEYIWTEGNPIDAVKRLLKSIEKEFDKKYRK